MDMIIGKKRLGTIVAGLVGLAVLASACSGGKATAAKPAYRIFGAGSRVVWDVKLDAVETVQQIAPDVKYHVWTFGGTVPGPVIRVKQGDTVRFRLTNKSSLGLSHSIDFHAAQTPWDVNYKPVAPGKSLSFDWVARFPGAFMYHCGVPPVLHHLANGMYGAIIVEPRTPLPSAREYVLVASEFYAGDAPVKGAFEGDAQKMLAPKPTQVVWNGKANLYADSPLAAKPNERIRLWVVNAGPTLNAAFHVIGALFDHAYPDGNPTNQLNGIQTWSVPPGGGAMFELSIPDSGMYPFVTHAFAYTGLGAVGVLKVAPDAPAAPASYPRMADPFSGGVIETKGTASGSAPIAAPSETASAEPKTGEATTVTTKDLKFSPTSVDVMEGGRIELVNKDPLAHDFSVDALKLKVVVDASASKSFTIEADPGVYEFYCSVPGHKEAGMKGTLTVLPKSAH